MNSDSKSRSPKVQMKLPEQKVKYTKLMHVTRLSFDVCFVKINECAWLCNYFPDFSNAITCVAHIL